MADPFLGEIRIFGGNFAPNGWALCNGQLLSIAQNTALFSILGTLYGGDGVNNFALPNLQGRTVVGPGGAYAQGETGGHESVNLTVSQLPVHSHALNSTATPGTSDIPKGNAIASGSGSSLYVPNVTPDQPMANNSVGATGNGQPISVLSPFLVINFIISLQGIFPSRS